MGADRAPEEGTLRSPDGTRLAWLAWTVHDPVAVVAVAHGLGEHGGRYARLARALAADRIAISAVDLRGMGRSEGPRGHVDRWERWIEDYAAFHRLVVERARGVEVVPLGHSFGGVLVATAVLSGAMQPRRFVLSNPAFRPAVKVPGWKLVLGRAASGLAPRLAMGNEVDPRLLSREAAVVREYTSDPLVHDRISSRMFTEWTAASDRAIREASSLSVPVLLIVSGDDRIIDRAGALAFAERAGGMATLRTYPDRYHEPFNDVGSDEVFRGLSSWLLTGPGR